MLLLLTQKPADHCKLCRGKWLVLYSHPFLGCKIKNFLKIVGCRLYNSIICLSKYGEQKISCLKQLKNIVPTTKPFCYCIHNRLNWISLDLNQYLKQKEIRLVFLIPIAFYIWCPGLWPAQLTFVVGHNLQSFHDNHVAQAN